MALTNRDKVEALKTTITFMYEHEGKSKSKIANYLGLNRKILSQKINDWGLSQVKIHHFTPSNQKFLNKNKQFIKSKLDHDATLTEIADDLGVKVDFLTKTIIKNDETLIQALESKNNRLSKKSAEVSSKNIVKDLEGEIWHEILGYPTYYISNLGRVKHYLKTYDDFRLINAYANSNNKRLYVSLPKEINGKFRHKVVQVARLVGFSFIEGYSKTNNTIEHKDGNVQNNNAKNLMWVSALNDDDFRLKDDGVKRKFKKIDVKKGGKHYEFKTIKSFAKFINKSETQAQRYLDGKVKSSPYKINFIY